MAIRGNVPRLEVRVVDHQREAFKEYDDNETDSDEQSSLKRKECDYGECDDSGEPKAVKYTEPSSGGSSTRLTEMKDKPQEFEFSLVEPDCIPMAVFELRYRSLAALRALQVVSHSHNHHHLVGQRSTKDMSRAELQKLVQQLLVERPSHISIKSLAVWQEPAYQIVFITESERDLDEVWVKQIDKL
ncbi:hypothetical protein N0V91_009806 [Didymella pomorum]|uniref:Uncharacterized protein n=1 Tax=Didymella pomorum TaxID=749634 RepID=A0A9W8Z6P9_9PLEO|nr:hypothetical protein N0V91_009806 [Didymella pomorum]